VTVRDWVAQRTAMTPGALVEAMLGALGEDADAPAARAGAMCIAAATRTLESLIAERRFGRDSAIDLLAVDALTTLAFEFAAEHHSDVDAIADAAARGIETLSATLARV